MAARGGAGVRSMSADMGPSLARAGLVFLPLAGLGALALSAPQSSSRLLVLLLVAPLLEEAIFRAGLQEWLIRAGLRAWVCIGSSALVFAAAHLPWRDPWAATALLLPGLALGVIYQRTRSLWACVAMHAAMNACWIVVAALR
jgi:membrane protease YdiL (CAAX protease family)